MRDYHLDCVSKGNKADVMYWAEQAAKIGTEEDRQTYASLQLTFD
jgi:hypothetical protein